MDIAWHDTNFTFTWLNDSWTVWSNKSSMCSLFHNWFDFDHIKGWNTLSNTNNQIDTWFNSFKNCIGSKWRWNIDNCSFSTCCFHTFFNTSKNWYSEMLGSSLSFINSSNNIRSISNRLLSVESTMLSCHTLHENSSVLIDKNMGLCFFCVGKSSHHSVQKRSLLLNSSAQHFFILSLYNYNL